MNFLCRFFLLAVLLSICQPAFAEKRVALVIGNSNYRSAAALQNPANDAAAVAATLQGAGFDVVEAKFDLPAADMRKALRDFADQARDSDIAVIYYAGHGIDIDGVNYLIPTDAKLERDTDIYDEAFSLDRILLAIAPARMLRLVIVDACRNNPFADRMKRADSSRDVSRGLARVEPATTNTLVAFAAKAGFTVLDGAAKNSPYAIALTKYIARPGLDLRKAFGFIRDDVMQATGNRQEPYLYGSLGGEDLALVPARPAASAPAETSQSDAFQSEARRDLELAMQLGNASALNAFLDRHPDGYYASLARLQLAKMTDKLAEQGHVAVTAAESVQTTAPETAAADAKAATSIPPASPPPISPPAVETKQGPRLASLNDGPSQGDLVKSVQAELRRVGCLATSATDGEWDKASRRSLALFNKYAGTNLDVTVVSPNVLDAVKLRPARLCPLTCEHGFKADGDQCSRIACADGSFLNEDNECEKRRARTKSASRRDDDDRRDRRARAMNREDRVTRFEPPSYRYPGYEAGFPTLPRPPAARRAQAQGSGQIVCDDRICRPVRPGCHIESLGINAPRASSGLGEVCH